MVNATIYSNKYDYSVSFCAKSGCCTVRNIFLQLHSDEIDKNPENGIHDIHIYYPLTKNINDIPNIIVVRNPFSRVVSMFIDKYINNNMIMRAIKSKGHEIKNHSFMHFLELLKIFNTSNELDRLEGHVTTQSYNYTPNNKTIIVKLENLEEELSNAYKKIFPDNKNNIIENLKNMLNGPHKKNATNYNKSLDTNVTNKDFFEKKNIPTYKYFYNDDAKKIVIEIYEKDFQNFGYSKDL
jgi:hypothetical protein